MGMFIPCLLAAILNGCALQIFREPVKVGNGPLMALYIFILSTFVLLWSIRLYPRNFRRLGKFHGIAEFLIADFLMEQLITDFWFPLEKCVLDFLPSSAGHIEEWLADNEWSADIIVDTLKSEKFGYYVSYSIAILFLLGTLHASRTIDLRTLKDEGPKAFFKELVHKMKLQKRRFMRKLGFGKKKVKINECPKFNRVAIENNRQSDSSKMSHIGSLKRLKPEANKPEKINKYCPVHNPMVDDGFDSGDYSDFEEIGIFSDSDCT